MNKFASALVLTTTLSLGWAVPAVKADPITSLAPTTLSASAFNGMFTPVATAPAMSSDFQFYGAPVSGVVESQVFQGNAGSAAAGYYAYAYQIGVNSNGTTSTGADAHVDSASFHFNDTPVNTDLTGNGHSNYSYVVTNGQVGDLTLPKASPGGAIQTPTELSWGPDGTKSGVLRAKFEDSASNAPPLKDGANSATFIVLSKQAPSTQQFVNLQSGDPQIQPNGNYTTVYSPAGGTILPVPIPEPATVLAWAGMAGAALLVRRVRKTRVAA